MSSLNVTLTLFQCSLILEIRRLFSLQKRRIQLPTIAQINYQILESPLSIERNWNKSTYSLEQGNVTLTLFLSSNQFCWKSLSYSHFGGCSNTAMMNQCFGNVKQDQIWCYDDLMIQGYWAVIYSMFTSKEGTTDDFLLLSSQFIIVFVCSLFQILILLQCFSHTFWFPCFLSSSNFLSSQPRPWANWKDYLLATW